MESTDRLRFISASRVETPVGSLDELNVLNNEESTVGRVEGIVVDPAERQVRFLVLKARRAFRSRHYLLPLEPATLDAERKALHVDVQPDDLDELEQNPDEAFPEWSDDDLIDALFARHAH